MAKDTKSGLNVDEELIRRHRAGDESAFEHVVARWDPVILRLARRLTGDPEEARDVRQAALLRAYGALDHARGPVRPGRLRRPCASRRT